MAAYNPYATAPYYGGANFSPYYPTAMPAVQSQSQQSNVVNMVLVNSEDEARNYPVNPGGSIFLMDSSSQLFYTKNVDFSGIATFRKYQFHEITEEVPTGTADYITKEEFEAFKASLNRNRNQSYQKKERAE